MIQHHIISNAFGFERCKLNINLRNIRKENNSRYSNGLLNMILSLLHILAGETYPVK